MAGGGAALVNMKSVRDGLGVSQIGLACAAVFLGGGMRWQSLLIATLVTVLAFVRPLPPRVSDTSQRRWTFLILVALGLTIARAVVFADVLDAGVDFLLLLVAQRFFNRQRSREHGQMLLLGGLLMIVGAVINTGLNYPVLLSAYLVILVMALIVNHLMSEGERLGDTTAYAIERAARSSLGPLWMAAAQVATLAAAGGLFVFLVFPRFGVGVFLRGPTAREMQSGFSDEVQLGVFGRIKTDASVVMRIEPPAGRRRDERVTWYLRGTSFDEYADGRWRQGKDRGRLRLDPFGAFRVFAGKGHTGVRQTSQSVGRLRVPQPAPIRGFAASTEKLQTTVMLEDIGAEVLFAASEPLGVALRPHGAFERGRMSVQAGPNLQIAVNKPAGPIRYEFVSRIGTPTRSELVAVGEPEPHPSQEPYLQRNPSLSDEVSELARRLSLGTRTRLERVEAVMGHLASFGYTVDLVDPADGREGDPIESFLFTTREGHCEYFATAMAVLLREMDVPTRLVNGYYGAHWNQLGEFYAVRQADAHSWVEVHFGSLGWVTFDPTPPTGRIAGDQAVLWPAIREALDAARNAYLQYVVDYDLGKQMALLRGLDPVRHVELPRRFLSLLGVAGLGIAAVWWWLRRRPRGSRDSAATRIYKRVLAVCARRGHPRFGHESASRYAARMLNEGVPGASILAAFARLYETIRFGRGATEDHLRQLRALARRIVRGR